MRSYLGNKRDECHESKLPPNESRLSCGALKKDSFLIYARRQLQALVRRRLIRTRAILTPRDRTVSESDGHCEHYSTRARRSTYLDRMPGKGAAAI